MILRHTPNILTLARVLLIIPFLVFLSQQNFAAAFYLFLVAGLSDALDGWLARHYHWQSAFGSVLDPLADKLLIASSVIALALTQVLPWWFVTLIFLRDLTISLGALAWNIFIKQHIEFNPTFLSKINTFLQLTLVTTCLFKLAFNTTIPHFISTLIVFTTFTTSASYIDYVWTWGRKACAQLQTTL